MSNISLRLAALKSAKHIAEHQQQRLNDASANDPYDSVQYSYAREANNNLIVALYVRCVVMNRMPFFTFRDSIFQHWHVDIAPVTQPFIHATAQDDACQRLSPVLYSVVSRATAWELHWLCNEMDISQELAIQYIYGMMHIKT